MGYQPRNDRRPSQRRTTAARGRRGPGHAAKIALALVSLLVMSMTGYAWATLGELINGASLAEPPKPADGATDILLIGSDSRTDAQGNPLPQEMLDKLDAGKVGGEHNTDTLILLHIPNDGSKAVAVSIPRDSYVRVPGYGKHKINSAYSRAKLDARERLKQRGMSGAKLERRSSHKGAQTLIDSVEQLAGYTIEHYASINLLGFYSITQAVGGVKVCLKNPVSDPYSGANFPAGVQTISGADALAFVRQRHGLPRGDLDRVERQQAFMAGLARKILSADTLTDPGKLNALVDAVRKSVVLDQGWDILSFAKRMRGLTGGQVEFYTIPVVSASYQTPTDGVAVRVNPQRVHDFIAGLSKPAPKPSEAKPAPERRVNKSTITVNVRNGNGTQNLASNVSASLVGKGFGRGAVGNTSPRDSTVVRVAPGERATGKSVAEALGANVPVRESPSVAPGHASVLLGDDYSAPASGSSQQGGSGTQPGSASSPSGSQGGGASAQGKNPKPIDAKGIPCVN